MPAADISLLRLATRGSALARAQAALAAKALQAPGGVEIETVIVHTEGDRRVDVPIGELDGQGWFTAELERSLLDGRADVAVHSGKDLPSMLAPGLSVAGYLHRADPRDGVVTNGNRSLAELPPGSTVGTSSARRAGLLAGLYPALRSVAIRGNVDTRLRKLEAGECDALVLACAGLDRLGLGDRCSERLDPMTFVPSPAQGAIALEAISDSGGVASVRCGCRPSDDRRRGCGACCACRSRRRLPAAARRLGTDRGWTAVPRRRARCRRDGSSRRGIRSASMTRRSLASWWPSASDDGSRAAARGAEDRRHPSAGAG